MGVVNVTPDSFSDGGLYASTETAVRHGLALVEAGADLLDIGGESTRPGAEAVSVREELARVLPVITALQERTDTPISIDTTKSEVARQAVQAGATMINDISGLTFDPAIANIAAETDAALCLMHIQGTPRTMQAAPSYSNVVDEVAQFLQTSVARALSAGVPEHRICVDPGIGFGKRLEHNLALLNGMGSISTTLRRPILAGVSRKSFLGHLTGKSVNDRLFGTLAAVTASILRGAHLVRVHDVFECMDAVRVADALMNTTSL